MLADLRRDIVGKSLTSAESISNVHALLPTTKLLAIKLLQLPKLLKFLDLVVGIVQVHIAELKETTSKLTPCTLPLIIPSLSPRPPKTSSSAHMIPTSLTWLRPRDISWASPHSITFHSLVVVGQRG